MSRTDGPDELRSGGLSDARVAHQRHQYADAYRGLSEARHQGALPDDDLRLLADASWWLGLISAVTSPSPRSSTSATSTQGSIDPRRTAGPGSRRRVLFMRGEPAVGSAWLQPCSAAAQRAAAWPRPRDPAVRRRVGCPGRTAARRCHGRRPRTPAPRPGPRRPDISGPGAALRGPRRDSSRPLSRGFRAARRGHAARGFRNGRPGVRRQHLLHDHRRLRGGRGRGSCTRMDGGDRAMARDVQRLRSCSGACAGCIGCTCSRRWGDWDRAVAEAEQVLIELADFNQGAMAEAALSARRHFRFARRWPTPRLPTCMLTSSGATLNPAWPS